jgi:hypothetical protein
MNSAIAGTAAAKASPMAVHGIGSATPTMRVKVPAFVLAAANGAGPQIPLPHQRNHNVRRTETETDPVATMGVRLALLPYHNGMAAMAGSAWLAAAFHLLLRRCLRILRAKSCLPYGRGDVSEDMARYASEQCRQCKGRGRVETGEMENGPGGIGYQAVDCDKCMGTGEITSDDHEAFGSQHGIDVDWRGRKQVVFFDYEGDGVFVWSFPYDTVTDGQQCTEAERQSIYDELWAWYLDWTAAYPDDDRAGTVCPTHPLPGEPQ